MLFESDLKKKIGDYIISKFKVLYYVKTAFKQPFYTFHTFLMSNKLPAINFRNNTIQENEIHSKYPSRYFGDAKQNHKEFIVIKAFSKKKV